MTTHTVYWYKLKYHCNPFTQGYIGITNNFERRHKEHFNDARNGKFSHFCNAIRKHGENKIQAEILHKCSDQEALDFENYYRPETSTGWNMAVGGEDTLKSINCNPVTLYHKDNPEKLHEFSSHTAAAEALGIVRARVSQAVFRNSGHYGFDGWAVLTDESVDRSKTLSIQEVISARVAGVKRDKPSHFKGVTNRWTDEEKQRIGKHHKGKTISEKQKETVRRKNRKSHTSCKAIVLVHKDDKDKLYKYHSISEASRGLGLPLSRLKSKAQRPLNQYGKDGWAVQSLGS